MMQERQLIINCELSETRIAVVENGRLVEFFVERLDERSLVGNIYKGRVSRVLPGMQSAFVEIGTDRTAFLFGGDVVDPTGALSPDPAQFDLDDPRSIPNKTPIENLLTAGEEITVQVSKEPIGRKGARVTMFLSIPGRYLVLIPEVHHVGVSRRIENPEERERLRLIAERQLPPTMGIIVRTAAENIEESLLTKDKQYLQRIWTSIEERRKKAIAPHRLYQEADISIKITRDFYTEQVSKIIVDDQDVYNRIKQFLDSVIPGASAKLVNYQETRPIFDKYGLEIDLSRALNRKVWLPSGGYIVIDQTEALTSFDVNTGKYVGQFSAQETILQTNMEAAREIPIQLRLRNIGGIIVVDFIDMERIEDREKLVEFLESNLKADKARTNVLPVSEFGLVQMTRKRTSDSLERILMEGCPLCDGRGRIPSCATEAYNLIRDIKRFHSQTGRRAFRVKTREDIKTWLLENEEELLAHLKTHLGITVEFTSSGLSTASYKEPSFAILDR